MLLFNRLLPVGIVVYRYTYVCQSHLVQTAHQRRRFNSVLSAVICAASLALTFVSGLYREKNLHYLKCIGRENFVSEEKQSGTS